MSFLGHHSFLNIKINHFPLLLSPVQKTCLQFSGITKWFPKHREYPYTQAHALRLTHTHTHTHTHTLHTYIIVSMINTTPRNHPTWCTTVTTKSG